jgi:hypothetical protein
MQPDKTVYRRTLPGGGFVNVEVDPGTESGIHRAHVAVERRADPSRRDGHAPPVIASAEGRTLHGVFAKLFAIAADNVSVALALLRSRPDGKARF